MKLKVFHENEWREYPARVFTEQGWQSFTPRNISGIKRIWPRSETPPPAGTTYEWAGEPHASESIKRVDGVEVARAIQLVGPLRADDSDRPSISYTIPEGAENLSWRVQFRSTSPRDEESGGYHMTFMGFDVQGGSAMRFPDDGEWHDAGQNRVRLRPEATEGSITFIASARTSDWYDLRNFQAVFDDEPWPDHFDGGTESDRANDLWYNQNDVPHEWVNGQGWVEL